MLLNSGIMAGRMESLGDVVRRLRESKGWTQQKLATLVDVTVQTIWNLETGATNSLKLAKLPKLAESLDLPLADVLFLAKNSGAPHPDEMLTPEEMALEWKMAQASGDQERVDRLNRIASERARQAAKKRGDDPGKK